VAREALGDVAPPPQAAPESPPPPAPDPQPRRPHYLVVGAALLVALVALFGGMRLVQLEIERRRAGAALALPTVTVVPTVAPPPQPTTPPASLPRFTVESVLDSDSSLAKEIRAAEELYWEVYGDALYTLDTSHLSEVAAGEELNRLTALVGQLKADGYAVQMRIDHVSRVFNASASKAYIHDRSTDRSLLLKADTKEPVAMSGPDPAVGEADEHVYTYERIDGVWKVTSGFSVLNRDGN
jgi:hypothetical protein